MTDYFYTEITLSAHLQIPRRTLQRWRTTGEGPSFIRAGARRILYRREAVEAWAASREFRHRAHEATSQNGLQT